MSLYTQDCTTKLLPKNSDTFCCRAKIRKVVINKPSNYIWDLIDCSLKQDLPEKDYRTVKARHSWPWKESESVREETENNAGAIMGLFGCQSRPDLNNPSLV